MFGRKRNYTQEFKNAVVKAEKAQRKTVAVEARATKAEKKAVKFIDRAAVARSKANIAHAKAAEAWESVNKITEERIRNVTVTTGAKENKNFLSLIKRKNQMESLRRSRKEPSCLVITQAERKEPKLANASNQDL